VHLLGAPPMVVGAGKIGNGLLVDRQQEIHGLLAVTDDFQAGNTPYPRGANAGNLIDRVQKRERLRHAGTVTEALKLRQAVSKANADHAIARP